MNLEEQTKQIMRKYNIYAAKSLGQNFLINDEVVDGIIEKAQINENDLIIEIGPGLGTLTERLLEKAGKVVCIELDNRMIKILKDRFANKDNFQLIHDDVLKVDLQSLINENANLTAKVVANLPYYITTPIIMKLLEERLKLQSITVMVQKEVADRLTAHGGQANTGAITYTINYYTKPCKVIDVPSSSFIPAPQVDSSVIKLDVLSNPSVDVKNEELFFKVIKCAFMQKRKTLLNSLTSSKLFGDKQTIEEMLNSLGINSGIRAEKLTIEDFAKITKYIDDVK